MLSGRVLKAQQSRSRIHDAKSLLSLVNIMAARPAGMQAKNAGNCGVGCGRYSVANLRPSRWAYGRQPVRPPGGSIRQWTLLSGDSNRLTQEPPLNAGYYIDRPALADRAKPIAHPPPAGGFSSPFHPPKDFHGPAYESHASMSRTPP